MRSLILCGVLLALFPFVAIGGQGPHLGVELAEEGLRITNSGTLRLSTDAHLEVTSSSMEFKEATWGLGPLGGGRSVVVGLQPHFIEGACEGFFEVAADGRNIPRLSYGPFEVSSPELEVEMGWGAVDAEGWRLLRISLEAAQALPALSVSGAFPDTWRVDGNSVTCGVQGRRGGGGCVWDDGFVSGTVGVRLQLEGTPGAFAIVTRSGDGCVRRFGGALR